MSLPIHLLLRLAGPEGPVLRQVDLEEARPPAPTVPAEEKKLEGFLASLHQSPNSLPHQRWGVVIPEGDAGNEALKALAPLVALRELQQGGKARIYRVPPHQDEE